MGFSIVPTTITSLEDAIASGRDYVHLVCPRWGDTSTLPATDNLISPVFKAPVAGIMPSPFLSAPGVGDGQCGVSDFKIVTGIGTAQQVFPSANGFIGPIYAPWQVSVTPGESFNSTICPFDSKTPVTFASLPAGPVKPDIDLIVFLRSPLPIIAPPTKRNRLFISTGAAIPAGAESIVNAIPVYRRRWIRVYVKGGVGGAAADVRITAANSGGVAPVPGLTLAEYLVTPVQTVTGLGAVSFEISNADPMIWIFVRAVRTVGAQTIQVDVTAVD